jgi:hypothetical protein
MHGIVFSDDMCVRKNTLRGANVQFVRLQRTNRAMSAAEPAQKSGKAAFLTATKQQGIPCRFAKRLIPC